MQKLFGASTVDRALAKAETLQNVRRSGRFLGMAELYAMLRAQHPGMAIHYLSNAPDTLVGRYHRRFIREASFPVGHCHFRSAVDILTRVEHKRETIDRLTLRRPTTVILIGDNGESDPDIYAQASTRLRKAGVRTLVYIRQAYPPSQTPQWTGPRDDQIEFVTPVEVALHLIGEGMLDDAQVQSFADKWSQQIAREASWAVGQNHPTSDISRFLPEWMGCDGFEWPTPTGSQWPAIETIVGSLAGRCTNMTRAKRKH
ncbi:MAG: DUF2183 domain-containing protein [Chromatiales bacterium]|nr:DUF2183 domain-containing protein [Chromatiales bacterium]